MPDSRLQREIGFHYVDEVRAGRMTRAELIRRGSVVGLSLPFVGALLAACGGSSSGTTAASSGAASATSGAASATSGPATAATSTAGSGAGKPGGTLKITVATPTGDVDPVTQFDAGAIAITQQVAEYLAWVDPGGKLRPVLAESWQPDAAVKSWTFKIRQGVSFNDGRPLTTDDVVASFDRLTDPKSKSAALSAYGGVLSAGNTEKVDEATVVFHLDRPFADFPYFVSSAIYNALILPKDYAGDFVKKPVGTGPFLLADYKPKQSAAFTKNSKYWQHGRPYLDGVQMSFFSDTQAELLAMQAGQFDAMLVTPPQGSEPLAANPDFTLLEATGSAWYELHMRVTADPWRDRRVRQAVAWAVDRKAMLDTLYKGKGTVGNDHIFAPSFPVQPDVPPRTRDVGKAKQLLAAAGKGSGFKVTLATENVGPVPNMAAILKENVKDLGIDVSINAMPQSAYYGSGDNQPWIQVPFGLVDWAARAVPSQFFIPMLTCKGIWNGAKWCNPAFDRAGADYNATVDEAKRKQLATTMARIMQDEVPVIVAFWIGQTRATKKSVKGLTADPSSYLDLTNTTIS